MDVSYVAQLANLSLTPAQQKKFALQFDETLKSIDVINQIDTSSASPTSQVTGLKNISRHDLIDTSRILPQSDAISQSHKSHQGYIVVPAIFHDS